MIRSKILAQSDPYGAIRAARKALEEAMRLLDEVEVSVEVSELVTRQEAAEMLGCTKQTVSNWIKEGKLNIVARGTKTGIEREQVSRIIAARGYRS